MCGEKLSCVGLAVVFADGRTTFETTEGCL